MRKGWNFFLTALLAAFFLGLLASASFARNKASSSSGQALVKSKGCLSCHTTTGQPLVGPSYKGIYGKKVTVMVKGRPEVKTVDEKYLKFMIKNPGVWVVKGYQPDMPKIPLTEGQIDDIIAYIKTLK